MDKPPDEVSRRVILSKAQRATPAGGELIALLTDLSSDGVITREEMARLRAWLEVDRAVDFAACGFLYEVVDTIAADEAITEQELDTLALAIERVFTISLFRLRSAQMRLPPRFCSPVLPRKSQSKGPPTSFRTKGLSSTRVQAGSAALQGRDRMP
jgi:hypothetical protein